MSRSCFILRCQKIDFVFHERFIEKGVLLKKTQESLEQKIKNKKILIGSARVEKISCLQLFIAWKNNSTSGK